MILMNVKLDNFLIFNNFELSTTYPKKIIGSTISQEHLLDRPNFRYKKLIVLMGANASGKTALGKVLMSCFNFIAKKEYKNIITLIEDRSKDASFEIDFAFSSFDLYRINALFAVSNDNNSEYNSKNISVTVRHEPILKTDNYERCAARLAEQPIPDVANYIMALEQVPALSWDFEFPFAYDGKQHAIKAIDQDHFTKILEKTLQVLDPRIHEVKQVPNMNNAFAIIRSHDALLINEGKIVDPNKLSSGTAEGIGVADIVSAMKLDAYDFYYCDEKFSHIHTDLEKAFLSLFIELLGDNQQMFFTTHNSDILEMDLPKHTFAFLRKDDSRGEGVSCVYASDYLKKNTDSLKNAVENDLFSYAPNLEGIYKIKEL